MQAYLLYPSKAALYDIAEQAIISNFNLINYFLQNLKGTMSTFYTPNPVTAKQNQVNFQNQSPLPKGRFQLLGSS